MRGPRPRDYVLALVASGLAVAADPSGAPSPDPYVLKAGAALYKEHCVACHGTGGRGDGPRAAALRYPPADLTLIAAANEGRFPASRVRRIVDGRDPVKGHVVGGDMPAWGDALKDPVEGYAEAHVQRRLDALVSYLATLQRTEEEP